LETVEHSVAVEFFEALLQIPEHGLDIVREPPEVIEHIDEQILLAGFKRIGGDTAELELFSAEIKIPRPLMIVDDIGVVDLGQTESEIRETIVRGQQEVVRLEEGADKFPIIRRQGAPPALLGAAVESVGEFANFAAGDKSLEVSVDRR
jgi:hypothetical protein